MHALRIRLSSAVAAAGLCVTAWGGQANGFATGPMTQPEALRAFVTEIKRRTAKDEFAGAVLVAKDGKPVFEEAYGLADTAKKLPNKVTTQFCLGSNNKVFTSVAILQLAEAGKLNVNNPIGKYLPDYPNKDLAKVTIEELLTHRGAAGEFVGPEFLAHRAELRTLEDYVKLFGNRGPDGVPGGKPVYSNYGYILLGVIIERVSGEDYYSYIDQHVYKPAGMTSSSSPLATDRSPGRAIGYTMGDDRKLRPNDDSLPFRGTSAGGGYSTVEDMLRFYNALWDHKLLNAHSVQLLVQGEATRPGGPQFPYGMGGMRANGIRYYGHAGGAPGMSAEMESSPESGYTIVVLANRDPMVATELAGFLRTRLPVK